MDNRVGYFLISLDTELSWGHYDLDQVRQERFADVGSRERRNTARLIELFSTYGIVGTWAIVGHLFYDKCEECEICPVRPWEGRYSSFSEIHGTDSRQWYGSDMVQALLKSSVPQEIGFHGYTHRVFSESEMTADEARVEAKEWLRVAARWGIGPGSIVFPRNKVGHLPIFKELGFVCYRGEEPVPDWWVAPGIGSAGSLAKPLRSYLSTPHVYHPRLDASGLVDLPASRWMGPVNRLESRSGLRSLYNLRQKQMVDAVRRAAAEKKVVHLWLHPYEYQSEEDLDKIRDLLAVVAELSAAGTLRSVGMTDLAQQALPALLGGAAANLATARL